MLVRTTAAVILAGSLALVGCEEKPKAPAAVQKAADATKAAADKAAGAVKDAGKAATETATKAVEGAKDAAGKAVEGAKDAGKAVADKAGEAVAALQNQAKTWLSDTVTKQWPGVKDQIAGLEKTVGALGAGDIKTKATDLLGKIKADVPKMEGLVGQLQNFKDGDFGKLFDEAKKLWDSFAPRLGELTKMLPSIPAAPGGGK